MRKSFNDFDWLQISDLHIFESTDWTIMQEAYKKLKESYNIKFIVVTGDLHQYGQDYTKTITFLNKLLNYFELTKNDIFILPGNHDAEDCEDKEAYLSYIDSNIDIDQDCYYKYFREDKLRKCFRKYNEFVLKFYEGSSIDFKDSPEDIQLFKWKNKINFLLLNSAIICNGNNERKQIIDIKSLPSILEKINTKLPTLILAHHAFDYLCDRHQESLRRIFTDYKVSAYLCGDLHKKYKFNIPIYSAPNASIPCIVCGKSSFDCNDGYSDFGCIVYKKESSSVFVFPYLWDLKRKRFYPYDGFNSDQGSYYFNLHIMNPVTTLPKKSSKKVNDFWSIWLPDAEDAKGTQTRFNNFTATREIQKFLSSDSGVWGISAVKGIGKTFVLQVKRTRCTNRLCLPVGVKPSSNNNWATEAMIFDNEINLAPLKDYNNIIALWKFSIVVYAINQCTNYLNYVRLRKNTDNSKLRENIGKVVDSLAEMLENGRIAHITYEMCNSCNYDNLNAIIMHILKAKDGITACYSDYHKLLIFRHLLKELLILLKKKSIAIFIDKIDQAIKLTNAEPPVECLICEKRDKIEKCKSIKDITYCIA